MKLYADLPGRRLAQITADVLMVAWVAAWVWIGVGVHSVTMLLAHPGRTLELAGRGFTDKMQDAGASVDNLPLLNDRLATPFNNVAGVGSTIEGAGTDLVDGVTKLALVLGVVTAAIPILLVGAVWLWKRGEFTRRASAAQKFIDNAADLDLFALRAMASQPMHKLAAISSDPVGAWRNGDTQTIGALALLELRDYGLRPPQATGHNSPAADRRPPVGLIGR